MSFSGSVAQLLDSLEEVQILSEAYSDDIDFLHRFLDNNQFQSLLEVKKYLMHAPSTLKRLSRPSRGEIYLDYAFIAMRFLRDGESY